MNEDATQGEPPGGIGFGGTIFLDQSAHVAVLDGAGRIIAVNAAWEQFGRDNGLDPSYGFAGVDYLEVCARAARAGAVESPIGREGAAETLAGLREVLAARADRFSITYPCHAPHEQRWFLLYARPLTRGIAGAVVSHVNVTSLKLAGLVPDETDASRGGAADVAGAGRALCRLWQPAAPSRFRSGRLPIAR